MHIISFLNNSWNQIWPNLVAGLLPSGTMVVSHIKRTRLAVKHHKELKAHISAQDPGQTPPGHDRIGN